MRVIIVGCGRVGARVAAELDTRGEHVTVIDISQRAFNRLPQTFGGETVRGNGTDEDVVRTAGAEQADIFMALTEGDNRNALAAQIAKHTFGVPRVIAKINDPLRGEAYRALGVETICRTIILGDALVVAAQEGAEATNGFVEPATAEPRRIAPGAAAPAAATDAPMDDVDGSAAADDASQDATIVQPGEGGF
ncbi:MAG: TrkA family potassium uptake protein [Chloroflexi bacterium]|nr:TrkA family potassium uptake protein [Chloroflexota bacterium]